VAGPGDGHHDGADGEGDKGRSDFPDCLGEGLTLGEVGLVDLQHEQRNDDREDAIAEGEHPHRVVSPLVALQASIVIHAPFPSWTTRQVGKGAGGLTAREAGAPTRRR
jgi:hypothetical protein